MCGKISALFATDMSEHTLTKQHYVIMIRRVMFLKKKEIAPVRICFGI